MREVLNPMRSTSLDSASLAEPRPGPGQLLISSVASVVLAGTERMLTDFAPNLSGAGRRLLKERQWE